MYIMSAVNLSSTTKWSEPFSDITNNKFRLFPGCKVPTFVVLPVINHVGICFFCPALWKLVEFFRKNAHDNGNFDTIWSEKIIITFPIETEPGKSCISQPGKRKVIKDIIPSEAGRLSCKYT